MEYKPKLPKHNSNVSHQRPLKDFATLLAGTIAIFIGIYFVLGLLVDASVEYISPQNEAAFFSQLSNQDIPLTGEPAAEAQQQKWQQLLTKIEQCANVGYPIQLTVVDNEQINAMAWPGGKVTVFTGLDDVLVSENAMAFVLAHELAHFSNRDHLRMMGRGVVLMSLLALIGQTDSNMAQVITPINNFETAQFSQFNESQADKRALATLNCTYGHVGGATEFFEKLLNQPQQLDFAMMHYFSTHPELKARIMQIEQLTDEMGYAKNQVINR